MSVNWHIWPRCNYRCQFCFATFRGVREVLPRRLALRVPRMLRDAGTRKITLAGGEPTLCPHLGEVLQASKDAGMTTMLVTNGSRLTDSFLAANRAVLDWVSLSVDSASEDVERELGRGSGGHVALIRDAARRARRFGLRIKVNSVVTSHNWQEDMHGLLSELSPDRWKVFQMLPIAGENDGASAQLAVTRDQFHAFLDRHADLDPIGEDNDAMTRSYVMLDPLGRFFQNDGGRYRVGPSIFEAGALQAFATVGWDREKFLERGGLYEWSPGRHLRGEMTAAAWAEGVSAEW